MVKDPLHFTTKTDTQQPVLAHASGALLAEGARFNESIARLAMSTFVAKGVYRFKSHEEANRQALDCLVNGMAKLAATRACSVP